MRLAATNIFYIDSVQLKGEQVSLLWMKYKMCIVLFLLKLAQIFCKMLELNSRQVLLVKPIKFFSQANAMHHNFNESLNCDFLYVWTALFSHSLWMIFNWSWSAHSAADNLFLFVHFFLYKVSKNVSVDFFFIFPTSSIFLQSNSIELAFFQKYSNVYIRRVYVRFIAR